ncbi:MAG: sulfatase-like hydrolase/transferase [Candidatus Marinimicrobia bacterium]|nr:sulfatase-like hydrolase/transferase [Candidatus Neomarinimicrobiota bacterium]
MSEIRNTRMDGQPNILFITAEQFNADCIGTLGRPQLITPNLDALVRGGVSFMRSYSVAASCVPSRISVLTGQYPHTHGVYNRPQTRIPDACLALPQYLQRERGYQTALLGKNHIAQWNPPAYQKMPTEEDSKAYRRQLEQRGVWEAEEAKKKAHVAEFMSFDSSIPYEDSDPIHLARLAIQTIDDFDSAAPFFLSINYQHAHNPYRVPVDAPIQYDPDRLDLEQVRHHRAEDRRLLRQRPGSTRLGCENIWNLEAQGEPAFRRALARYYGMVSLVDDSVGRLVAHLDQRKLLANTLIIFTADHGDFAGEYGMLGKGAAAGFEAIMRVPLICYWKGTFGPERVHSLVENIDLFPTVCDLLGLEVPHTVQGESFADVLRYSASGCDPYPRAKALAFHETLYCKTVITRDAILSYGFDGCETGELFDLRHDPEASINHFGEPQYGELERSLMRALTQWWIRTDQPLAWGAGLNPRNPELFRYVHCHPELSGKPVPDRVRIN